MGRAACRLLPPAASRFAEMPRKGQSRVWAGGHRDAAFGVLQPDRPAPSLVLDGAAWTLTLDLSSPGARELSSLLLNLKDFFVL